MRSVMERFGFKTFAGVWAAVALLWLFPALSPVNARNDRPKSMLPEPLQAVGIDQRLDNQVPLDLEFTDESGQDIRLAEILGERPVILALVYFECPMLCNQVLNGLVGALKGISFTPGVEYEVIAASFDAREGPESAHAKKEFYLERYNRRGTESGWHFLTGSPASIGALTDAVGFRYAFDERSGQYAHASGIMVLTPEGRVSRYFYGIEYAPRDIRLALVESSRNAIGSPADQLLLFCFQYDPSTGTYGAMVMNLIRAGGLVTFVGLGILIVLLRRRESRRRAGTGGST